MSRSARRRDLFRHRGNGDAGRADASGRAGAGNGGTSRQGDQPPTGNGRVVTGAGGVVFDVDGRVLLIRHRSGSWVFPKGHVESGETALEAALREVEEEAGVTAQVIDATRSWITSYRNPRGEQRRITWFRLRTDASAPVLREALFPGGGFFEPLAALARLSFDEDRGLLRTILRELEGGA